MLQIIQSLKSGETTLEEIPCPTVKKGSVLIRTTKSLVSLGTEKMLVEFGKSNIISKARQQPEKVKQVLEKIQSEGLLPTLEAVFNKLEQPLPLGYCNVGQVIEVGENVTEFKVGDRVASNGNHAEFVCIPKNLVALIPDNVSDEEAAFTVIGAIGLQGIRLLNPNFGETFIVYGLGLIGLITAQLLKSNGCNVIGIDIDKKKLDVANKMGIETFNSVSDGDFVKYIEANYKGIGVDGVLITASSKSNLIISQSAKVCRKRGRIILIGVVGLELNRSEFFEKEITFQVSCSYGPGRYDENYENKGIDYPISYVRWTEKRNFEAVLSAISKSKISVKELISRIVPLSNFKEIYNEIGSSTDIASILDYSNNEPLLLRHTLRLIDVPFSESKGVIGIIGAGNFTKMTMLPVLSKFPDKIKYIASSGGVSGTSLAKKYKIPFSTTDYNEILEDSNVDLVFITTRPNSHSKIVEECLKKGKSVFVEKPLAITIDQLDSLISLMSSSEIKGSISVGFNRRFSPHSIKLKSVLGNSPINILATMNAGNIPQDSWIQDFEITGGRIISEACHFIDLITFFTGSLVSSVCMSSLGVESHLSSDNVTILLKYKNGSNGVINYFSNGSKSYQKERIEVYSLERTAIIDNFKKTEFYGFKGCKTLSTKLDKGHYMQFKILLNNKNSRGYSLIPIEELINTSKVSFAAIQSLKENRWVDIV